MMAPAWVALAASMTADPATAHARARIVSLRVLPFFQDTGAFGTDLFDPSAEFENPEVSQPIDVHVMAVVVAVSERPNSTLPGPKVHLVVTTGGYEPGETSTVVMDRTFSPDTGWGGPRASIVTLVRVKSCPYISFKASLVGHGKERMKERSIQLRCGPE